LKNTTDVLIVCLSISFPIREARVFPRLPYRSDHRGYALGHQTRRCR